MRGIALLLVALVGFGCHNKSHPTTAPSAALAQPYCDEVAASALVFDPPIAANEPALDLARDPREPSAFVGYDQLQTTFYYTVTSDRQGGFNRFGSGDWYQRQAVSARVGVSYR